MTASTSWRSTRKSCAVQDDLERVLFDEGTILRRLDEIADQISADYRERELTVLAEEAQDYTDRAREELAAVEAPYLTAQAAWEEAEQRWARLGKAIRNEVRALQEEQGIYSTRSVKTEAPGFPLDGGERVFQRSREGTLLARPGAISDISDDD